jgi:hypothetical protein
MGKHTDVKMTASGMPGGTPVGCTITYQVGSIPTAAVDLAPDEGGFGDVDSMKRKEASVSIEVKTYVSSMDDHVTRTIEFKGLLDGMTVVNSVGSNSYQAIIKNKAQRLLELTTLTPGMHPAGINIYRNPSYALVGNGQSETAQVKSWSPLTEGENVEVSSIEFYTNLLKKILKKQKSGWETFVGRDKVIDKSTPFGAIFNDDRYQKNVTEGLKILENIDISAVNGGTIEALTVGRNDVLNSLERTWKSAPNVLLEHYMHFLSSIGCSLIFSNESAYVIPENSVLKKKGGAPSKGKLQSAPNAAGPADYVSYHYNDNGYRDVAGVVVSTDGYVGGASLGGLSWETGGAGFFMEEKGLSQASGIYVAQAHPWMCLSSQFPSAGDSAKGADKMDKKSESMYGKKKGLEQSASETQTAHAEKAKEKKESLSSYAGDVIKNYAETKFYQVRFGDRQGSITMDFNPYWVPGTGGTLFVRETECMLTFYVQSVTHRIDMSAPSNGTAITTVSYTCGRIGKESVGTTEDKFLGYNTGKEEGVQVSFLSDMGAI